jgi:phenylglyoxylate dehydrogenase epsilon subunit
MNSTLRHVIVGAGTAGISAVEAIRKSPSADCITMISAESDAPYSPTVLPHLLAGRIGERDVALRSAEFFDGSRCRLVLGRTVTALDPDGRVVRLDDDSQIGFDRLLLAVGSEPLMPRIDNPDGVECLSFTRMADLRALRARLAPGCRVAILGAGLIGMELADALAHLGLGVQVLVVEQEGQVLPRTFNQEIADEVLALFRANGVRFQLGLRAIGLEKAGGDIAVTLSDHSTLMADLLIACVGVKPRVSFLADSGLTIGRGVTIDSRMATNVAGIYAAGDAAEGPSADGTAGCHPVLPTAAAQGRIAGGNMVGRPVKHEGWVPANFFNFFGRVAVSVGDNSASPGRHTVDSKTNGNRTQLFFEGDRLVGASFLGVPADPGSLSFLIRKRVPVKAHAELLLNRPIEASRWLAARVQRGN